MNGSIKMENLLIEKIEGPASAERDVEIVERKGLGHPDTICDSVMEQISLGLTRSYLERFGRILHHNCDKGLLAAGEAQRRLGGGRILSPMRLIIGDRAANSLNGETLDIEKIAVETAKDWFRKYLPRVDPDRHIRYQVALKPGSESLGHLFRPGGQVMRSNDTSAAVGYAPMSETEQIVLDAEQYLNSGAFKSRFPETGEDVKIMGVRLQDKISLTVALPFLDSSIESEADYFRRKEGVLEALKAHMTPRLRNIKQVRIHLNTLDRKGIGMAGMYLSVLGTSAEDADSGEVGRGNQVNGVISLNRPRGSEAAPGKNPVSHVGKIYSVLSYFLANRIQKEIPGIREVNLWLYARIGDPINRPRIISVQVLPEAGMKGKKYDPEIRKIIAEQISRIDEFCRDLAQGRFPIC